MSFNIALSGINAVNNQLNTISHNIANTGTYGFKSGRANFATMVAGAQPNGTYIGSITQNVGIGGSIMKTGRGLDAAIQQDGFFVTKDADGSLLYTRVGIFQRAADGYMVDGFGRRVQGYAANGVLGDLQVPNTVEPAKASDSIEYAGNLSADWKVPKNPKFDKDDDTSFNHSVSTTVYDSLGRKHVVTQYFVKQPAPSTDIDTYYAMDNELVGDAAPAKQTLKFDENGKLTEPTAPVALDLGTPAGAGKLVVNVNYTGVMQVGGDSSTTTNNQNGYAAGTPGEPSIDEKGNVVVQYSNGQKRTVGTVALAAFASADGLTAVGDTAWKASTASGNPLYGTPGSGMFSKLATASLEMSNADVTRELVDMMSAQRNYQANSKVIATENQMMQSLMQAL
ncbi:flagellar hook protein FlgE [Burkholderia oklahomensis]|uniref:Flagellar hook protein FlgE n=1 Tax=Burkholderia oklahomensis TaxID=342113 RepID=A0AAI8BD42_9BURK|nr:flagellar hook-basal body complex protein [Burkholderia oklahomensis]AIO69906.1 flagellar hook protein flgE [Burkholderia oklahomensis]AOI38251.1 flagellar biosynthesis protein FlgE [Burkholderia oklahomensis EO147]KUY48623.1 flagellar biosynthesis protein FlgE [Burkholderia oklahomensis EO147]QPS41411.1 flagellar hook-basal body complex protein [Burkholderia oklahomensis]